MKQILLPFDFSPHAKRALALAVQGFPFGVQSQVTLLHVLDKHLYESVLPSSRLPTSDEIASFLRAEVEKARTAFVGVTVSVEVALGPVVSVIATRLRSARYDGLIVGGQGHGGISEAILGTTASRLVRETTVPTFVVKRPSATGLPKTALCPLAMDACRTGGLQAAAALARDFGITFETLIVRPDERWPYAPYMRAELRAESERRAADSKRLAAFEVEALGRLASAARNVDYGSVADCILRRGQSRELVVLTGDRQAHASASLLGTTVEYVLMQTQADVLVAR